MKKRTAALLLILFLLLAAASAAGEQASSLLKPGSKGEAVVRLQKRLIELDYLSGAADGVYGEGTKTAVSAFQEQLKEKRYDVAVDGLAGELTQKYLYDDEVIRALSRLEEGDAGKRVAALQKRLYQLNFTGETPDGSFGPNTKSAVVEFQKFLLTAGVEDLKVSGVADENTRAMLKSGKLKGLGIVAPEFFNDEAPLSLAADYLNARAAILVDAETGEVLFEKNPDQKMFPASTTKILTLLTALKIGKTGRSVTIPEEAAKVPADSSLVPVTVGETMPMKDLLYALMIRSGNDAANAIAVLQSGSIPAFVEKMNALAAELGLSATHFTNPHGYHDPDHYTTARDLARLTQAALKNEAFRAVISAGRYTMAATEKRAALTIQNSYSILDKSSQLYYPGAFGVKTGSTNAAGPCYVGAAEKNGHTLIAVVLKAGLNKEDRWIDAARLFNYGFAKLG